LPRKSHTSLESAIEALCLAFPEAEAFVSHGSPNYRIRDGKVFATYAVNHHGDGRIALWLNMPAGVQRDYVAREPRHFFIPPYVGPRGWLGVRVDGSLAWSRIGELVRMAYIHTAPARLTTSLGATPKVPAPKVRTKAADVDPRNTPAGKRVLAAMRKVCLALPETTEGTQFGQPVWRAGKRVFAQAYCYDGRWRVAFWVGREAQSWMKDDPRFEVPAYMGHNGWIALDAGKRLSPRELDRLARESYRHFALKRMLEHL
jgi:predicted DNA-binding protein (MmcQ/YjbR family)